ncbi:Hypothetical predicted protein [Pelobates cultripes]|uniref:Uncharacterized protein n=1 Tax=Pelobates cultripes TaxID=61616 RepID=A0AAD1VZU7_PELCU|nr:Hypothetical predicted protein [Pelobates cultripes]
MELECKKKVEASKYVTVHGREWWSTTKMVPERRTSFRHEIPGDDRNQLGARETS